MFKSVLIAGLAFATMASATEVKINDLDLKTPQGRSEFNRRVEVAATEYCKVNIKQNTMEHNTYRYALKSCREGVRQELVNKL